jgi:trehalose 6-phosphate phosphatase
VLQSLVERIAGLPRPLLLAFDVDGTLAPIVDEPAAARVPAAIERALRKLQQRRGLRVALVTGRDAAALSALVKIPGAYRAVEHGRVVLAPGQRSAVQRVTTAQRARLDAFATWAEREAVPLGAELEHKASSRALHVRRLERDDPQLARKLLAAAARVARAQGLSPRPGRAVLEAELESGDKGDALDALVRKTRAAGVLYAGDDLTDRPAIQRAVELGGLGIFVRSPDRPRAPRGASASLKDQQQMAELVVALAERL